MVLFSLEEIRKAVLGSCRCKPLSQDGFSMAFFQDHWNLVKVELERVYEEFFEGGILNCSILEIIVVGSLFNSFF